MKVLNLRVQSNYIPGTDDKWTRLSALFENMTEYCVDIKEPYTSENLSAALRNFATHIDNTFK